MVTDLRKTVLRPYCLVEKYGGIDIQWPHCIVAVM